MRHFPGIHKQIERTIRQHWTLCIYEYWSSDARPYFARRVDASRSKSKLSELSLYLPPTVLLYLEPNDSGKQHATTTRLPDAPVSLYTYLTT